MGKAVIFDMDGVIVDSECYWAQAEKEIFTELGVTLTDDLTSQTRSMTTDQVIAFWYERHPWPDLDAKAVEELVISRLIYLISKSSCVIPGVLSFISLLKDSGFKIGLATNSPYRVIPEVLSLTLTTHLFDAVSSAEFEKEGKPNPSIYLNTAKNLEVAPENCLVIEDSHYGMLAAKRAGMRVIAFTNGNTELQFDIADAHLHSFKHDELPSIFQEVR